MTGLGLAVAVVLAAPAGAVAAGLAAAALFVFVVAVASAAFFFVGIVAFRSVVAAALAADVLVDLEALVAGGVGLAVALTAVGIVLRALGSAAVLPTAALATAFFAVAEAAPAWRALRGAGVIFAAERAGVALLDPARERGALAVFAPRAVEALARFTEAAGCAALRAATLDEAAGLAVRADDVETAFAPRAFVAADLVDGFAAADALDAVLGFVTEALAAEALAAGAFAVGAFAAGVLEPLAAAALVVFALAATGARTAALAALLSRAAGLVLGDMSATPEIGRSPGA